jgi:ubiquitin carboxyl-terminal hydrolase 10
LEAIAEPETLHDVTNRQNLKVEATKQVFIESLPPILILHLKRFIYDARAGVSKSHKIISYGTELEIPKECIAPSRRTHVDKRRYRLTGVVFHHGKTASGGHYSVCCRQNNGRWVNIDDT